MAEGRIVAVSVGWTVETDHGPQKTAISLTDFKRHCRPERVEDLLDDLQMLCQVAAEDLAGRAGVGGAQGRGR